MNFKDLPPEVLRFLKFDNFSKECLGYEKYFGEDHKFDCDIQKYIFFELAGKVNDYFEKAGSPLRSRYPSSSVIAGEALKNSYYYGKKPIRFRTYLSPIAMVYSFYDGGDYFKKKDVKECWESRKIHHIKTESQNKNIGYGFGTPHIYEMSDFIHVDENEGILFTGILRSNEYF